MKRQVNVFENPLDWAFYNPSHIAVLRALRDSKEGMSGRAVARQAGVNHQACAKVLTKLEGFGIIQRQGSAWTQLVRLNFRHFLVREILLPALRKEREFMTQSRSDIARKFKARALSTTIFGSAARGEALAGSDVDLLLIVESKVKREVVSEAYDFSSDFIKRYGIRLSPIVLTLKEAAKRLKKADPLMRNILAEGIDLGSKKIREVLS